MTNKAILFDLMNYVFSHNYAYEGNHLRAPDGFPTSSLYGVGSFLIRTLKNEKPMYAAVARECDGETFDGATGTPEQNECR